MSSISSVEKNHQNHMFNFSSCDTGELEIERRAFSLSYVLSPFQVCIQDRSHWVAKFLGLARTCHFPALASQNAGVTDLRHSAQLVPILLHIIYTNKNLLSGSAFPKIIDICSHHRKIVAGWLFYVSESLTEENALLWSTCLLKLYNNALAQIHHTLEKIIFQNLM